MVHIFKTKEEETDEGEGKRDMKDQRWQMDWVRMYGADVKETDCGQQTRCRTRQRNTMEANR